MMGVKEKRMKSKTLDIGLAIKLSEGKRDIKEDKGVEIWFEAYQGRLPEFGVIAMALASSCGEIQLGTLVTDAQRRQLPFDPLAWLRQHIPAAEWTFERDISLRATKCSGIIPSPVFLGDEE